MAIKVATYSETCKSLEPLLIAPEGTDVLVRMGGTMDYSKYPIQINSKIGTEISIDKFRFNQMTKHAIPSSLIFNLDTIKYFVFNDSSPLYNMYKYFNDKDKPKILIAKPLCKSGGEEIQIIEADKFSPKDLMDILSKIGPYVIQPLLEVTSEYRVHISSLGEVKVTKKVKKNAEDAFVSRDNHKVVVIENAVKPRLYKQIIEACASTLGAMGMDLLCFDVLYDSTDDKNHMFFLCESNTGPELIGTTKEWYVNQINKLIETKLK